MSSKYSKRSRLANIILGKSPPPSRGKEQSRGNNEAHMGAVAAYDPARQGDGRRLVYKGGIPTLRPDSEYLEGWHQMGTSNSVQQGPNMGYIHLRKAISSMPSHIGGPDVPPKAPMHVSRARNDGESFSNMKRHDSEFNAGFLPQIPDIGGMEFPMQRSQPLQAESRRPSRDAEPRGDVMVKAYQTAEQCVQGIEGKIDQMQARYPSMQKSSHELNEQKLVNEETMSTLKAERQSLVETRYNLAKGNEALEEKISKMEKEYLTKHGHLDGVIATLQKDKENRDKLHDERIKQIQENHDAEKKKLVNDHKLQVQEQGDRFATLKAKYEEAADIRAKIVADELATIKATLNMERQDAQERFAAKVRHHETQLATMSSRHQDELDIAKEKATVEIKRAKENYHNQLGAMTDRHNKIVNERDWEINDMKIRHEADKEPLRRVVASLKSALTKRDHFKTLSDYDLANRFQDISSEIDEFARVVWDRSKEADWPFPDQLLRNSENERRTKQHIIQNTLWVILYERIFCTPFRVLGQEGRTFETQLIERFGQGKVLSRFVEPRLSNEIAIKVMDERLHLGQRKTPRNGGEENYNVNQGYRKTVQDTTDDISKELKSVAVMSGGETQRMIDLVRKSAQLWLEVGQQRYRVFLQMSNSGDEPLRSRMSSVDSDGALSLVVVPELRRMGNAQGERLDKEEVVMDLSTVGQKMRFKNPFHGHGRPKSVVSSGSQSTSHYTSSAAFTGPFTGGSLISTNPSTISILPPPTSQFSGDRQAALPFGHRVSPIQVRDLNDLIRKRYALDVDIWSKRDVKVRDRHLVEDKMRRSDAALQKIMGIIHAWDTPEAWKSRADWDRLRLIRQRLEMDPNGKRQWEGNPPWEH